MRAVNLIGFTFVMIASVGCFKNTGPMDAADPGSGLSDVTIAVPSVEQYRAKFGPNCEALKFSPQLLSKLGEQDRCEATLKILSNFKLKISESVGSCEAGVTPSTIAEEGSFAGSTISQQVKKKCSYDVLIEVGSKSPQFEAYYSNVEASKAALSKEDLEDGQASVKLVILPTAAGVKLGFPGDEDASGIITRPPPTNSGSGTRPSTSGGNGTIRPGSGGGGFGSGTTADSDKVDVTVDIDLGDSNGGRGTTTSATRADGDNKPPTGTSDSAKNPPNLKDSMLGLYVSECKKIEPSDNQYEVLSLTVEKERIIAGRIVTTDPACRDQKKNVQFTKGYATFKLGEPRGPEKIQFIDIKIQKQNFAVLTVNGTKVWNIEKACGFSLWERGVPIEVMALEKTSPACSADLAGILRAFDVLQFSGEGIRVGKKRRDDDGKWYFLGLSEKTRPVALGKSLRKIVK